jgi:mitosis inhibitor protein kinase SWE1
MPYPNSGGGTLTLPSPTHVHHVDVTSAVRSIRRSLSRSPSKFRLVTKSPSSSPKSPLSPCPASPPKRAASQPTIFSGTPSNPPHTPSPLAVPFPPSAKLALRSSSRAKTAPARPSSRTRTSPKSPMKRALSQASDCGNAPPVFTTGPADGQENSTSPAERKSLERSSRMNFSLDVPAPVNHALSRLGGDGANDCHTSSTTSSPLKRSDAIMNLDQASLGSPVAKRRSLHGSASFGHDFNVFDHGPSSTSHFDIHDDSNHEYELSTSSITSENPSSSFTSMPRRSSSLRKSTLQQRHGEKTSWGRRHAVQVLAAQQSANTAPEVSTPNPAKNRPRLSLDQFMPPMARDSPFSSQGSLPNASMHMLNQPTHQPHPLSRTMTTSSSSSSIVDESPTHVPAHFGEQPRPKLDFSKSLPAGSLRPFKLDQPSRDDNSFATPQNYKSVKPLLSAFASTGLISKVNRNPEEAQVIRGVTKGVPDTPCKKHVNGFATYPAPVPGSAIAKARHIRHSFGTPSTPFNPHGNQAVSGTFGKPAVVFGSAFGRNGLSRRGSFLSIDGDECGESPDAKGDSQSSADFELPPTPTKQALVQQLHNGSPSNHRSFPASAVGYGFAKKLPRTSSKLNLFTSPYDQEAEDSDGSVDVNDSPTAHCRLAVKPSESFPSFGKSRAPRSSNLQSLTPSIPKSLTTSILCPPRKPGFAKISHVAPASPLERIDFIERLSPRTPQDVMLPPDPSGLSISNPRDSQAAKQGGLNTSMPPPATPTTGREYFPKIGDRPLSTTPISSFAPTEIDAALSSRFEKVELIGTGEFSQVYRVTQPASIPSPNQSFFFGSSTSPVEGRSPHTPMPERVFAVKKSRQPYQGTRDRQRKLQEVNVLKALGQSDHVVHLIDSWEERNYLYIQTEYCEEGSLDLFLSQVGRKGRLDDFRIWKVLLELSLVCVLCNPHLIKADFHCRV